MRIILLIIGSLLFLFSLAAHIYVRVRLSPQADSDLDDVYWEFEDDHPDYARYIKWSKLTLATAALGALLLFLTTII